VFLQSRTIFILSPSAHGVIIRHDLSHPGGFIRALPLSLRLPFPSAHAAIVTAVLVQPSHFNQIFRQIPKGIFGCTSASYKTNTSIKRFNVKEGRGAAEAQEPMGARSKVA
jgi:hypothetical protein